MISTNRVYKPAQKGLESARVLEGKESTHTERAGTRRDGGRGWRQGTEGGENLHVDLHLVDVHDAGPSSRL